MIETYPFLILIAGGLLAGCSAVLLRRAASVFGTWLEAVSFLAAVGAATAFGSAFYWASTLAVAPPPLVGQTIFGWLLALGGAVLAGWGLRARGIGALRRWETDRMERLQPMRTLRRPIELGTMILMSGLSILRATRPVGVCLLSWIVAWSLILELGDWELRQRLPACRDYFRRTPRYLPRPASLRTTRRPPSEFST